MIKEITQEIDATISKKVRSAKLSELVSDVIADKKDLPEGFVDMCYKIHEMDTLSIEDKDTAKDLNLNSFDDFINFLIEIKEENQNFWDYKAE